MESFRRVVTNIDLDPLSRHFHYVAFDERRNALVATLGDGNLTRVVMSPDYGRSWRVVYRGPWQFVPVLIEEDRWLFGFDSGIAKGGVALYYPDNGKWEFVFLRPKSHPRAQFAEFKKLRDLYVGVLGYPGSVIVSRSIDAWHALYRSDVSDRYEFYVSVDALGDIIYAVISGRLMTFNYNQVQQTFIEDPMLVRYGAHMDKLRGLTFVLKRMV